MHFQHPPYAETKLVSCIHGKVLDVAIDLRSGSPTFLQAHTEEISATNNRALLIPEGFAHGFQALSADCQLVYVHSKAHAPEAEDGIHPEDPMLGIDWPLRVTALSPRDRDRPFLSSHFGGLKL
jgi:dTDP-4-dehydrorhamnose 3,5-epimerase